MTLRTCACILQWEEPLDERKITFLQQCIAHDTPAQTLTHNRGFNNRYGKRPSENDLNRLQTTDLKTESSKAEFQRR